MNDSAKARRPRVLYFINGFNRGGAELGLPTLIEGGLFSGCDLQVSSIVRGSGELVPVLQRLGVSPLILVDRERMRPWHMLAAAIRLGRLLRAGKFDVLLLSLPQANILGRLMGKLFGVRTIISFEHNTHLAKRAYEHLFRWTSPWVKVMFADCRETARIVAQRLYRRAPDAVHIVPLRHFPVQPLSAWEPSSDRVALVTVGRLTPVKNHEAIIRAVGLLRARGMEITLDVIGEGPLLADLRRLRDASGLQEHVAFPGFVNDWWTRRNYDGFVLASRHEGLCIVALEAMWAGIPLIAPPVGGICDYGNRANMEILTSTAAGDIAAGIEVLRRDKALTLLRRMQAHATVARLHSEEAARQSYAGLKKIFEEPARR